MIDKETIEHVAKISRLKLNEEEKEELREDIDKILSAFEIIKEVGTENIEPSFQPFEIKNVTREDKIEKSLSQKEALKNAEQTKDNFFKGPRAV
ncbi:MAG: Asp-tRNA(Asn)/Glu-tRNA(Gln) amidotransferase subunit GatC [Candidatus Aenigmarchaeota archaeon]|nr:Asp-tRNA(Asn)/Glu-tRNA(Gln) amidotransferase subunit GatC [Candidatus Aenigmarchaeota archaeon]